MHPVQLLYLLFYYDRETIEAIFQQISAGCRSEMEAVMESAQSQSSSSSSGDVSPACKEEIQASAQRVAGSGRGKTNKRSSSASSSSSSSGGGDTTSQKEDAASVAKDSSQSILVVVAALFLLFGIVIGYAIYANANLSQQGGSQKKSLRKKVINNMNTANSNTSPVICPTKNVPYSRPPPTPLI